MCKKLSCLTVAVCLCGMMMPAQAGAASGSAARESALSKAAFYVPATRPGMVDRYDLAGKHGGKPWLKQDLTKDEIKTLRHVSKPMGRIPGRSVAE